MSQSLIRLAQSASQESVSEVLAAAAVISSGLLYVAVALAL